MQFYQKRCRGIIRIGFNDPGQESTSHHGHKCPGNSMTGAVCNCDDKSVMSLFQEIKISSDNIEWFEYGEIFFQIIYLENTRIYTKSMIKIDI